MSEQKVEYLVRGSVPDDTPDLGPCCVCGEDGATVVRIHRQAPADQDGWSCATCGLSPKGAVAVLCDSCLALCVEGYGDFDEGLIELLQWLVSRSAPGGRVQVDAGWRDNAKRYDHSHKKHPEMFRYSLTPKGGSSW